MHSIVKVKSKREGRGLLNKLISKLTVELHLLAGLNKKIQTLWDRHSIHKEIETR